MKYLNIGQYQPVEEVGYKNEKKLVFSVIISLVAVCILAYRVVVLEIKIKHQNDVRSGLFNELSLSLSKLQGEIETNMTDKLMKVGTDCNASVSQLGLHVKHISAANRMNMISIQDKIFKLQSTDEREDTIMNESIHQGSFSSDLANDLHSMLVTDIDVGDAQVANSIDFWRAASSVRLTALLASNQEMIDNNNEALAAVPKATLPATPTVASKSSALFTVPPLMKATPTISFNITYYERLMDQLDEKCKKGHFLHTLCDIAYDGMRGLINSAIIANFIAANEEVSSKDKKGAVGIAGTAKTDAVAKEKLAKEAAAEAEKEAVNAAAEDKAALEAFAEAEEAAAELAAEEAVAASAAEAVAVAAAEEAVIIAAAAAAEEEELLYELGLLLIFVL